jgi:transposase
MAQDLDERTRTTIVELYNEGSTGCAIAKRLCLCTGTVYSIIKLYKETGSIKPRYGKRGPKLLLSDSDMQYVKALLDLTGYALNDIIELLELNATDTCLRNNIKSRLHYTYKKKHISQPNSSAAIWQKSGKYTKSGSRG